MTTATLSSAPAHSTTESVLKLHDDAWAAWNASYDAPNPHDIVAEAHRIIGRSLYTQAVHAHIEELNARSDRQNALLDRLIANR